VEHERLFPGRQTYARYLHVAEAVAENAAQVAWDGLGGRLKALRREVAAGQADAKAGQAEAKADVANVKTDVAGVKADMAEVKADVADMKALLEQLVARR
jgi:hypothetical protein